MSISASSPAGLRQRPNGRAMPSPSAIPLGCSGCFTGQRRRAARRSAPSSASRASTASAPTFPPSRVAGMRRGLRRDAYQTLEAFWRGCGTEPFASPEALNVGRLDEGLGWLMDWDETETKAKLACPISRPCRPRRCHRAASDERGHLAQRHYPSGPTTGGHVLPLKHPEWCANHVLDFAHALQP